MYAIDLESRVDIVNCLVWNFGSMTFLPQRVTKVLKTEEVFMFDKLYCYLIQLSSECFKCIVFGLEIHTHILMCVHGGGGWGGAGNAWYGPTVLAVLV